jgi:hypothetical protein
MNQAPCLFKKIQSSINAITTITELPEKEKEEKINE